MVQHTQEETKVLRDIRAYLDPIPKLRNEHIIKEKGKLNFRLFNINPQAVFQSFHYILTLRRFSLNNMI
jgi:hypothetical protein